MYCDFYFLFLIFFIVYNMLHKVCLQNNYCNLNLTINKSYYINNFQYKFIKINL